eukprot:TRINITY_DN9631_c0_g1_i1.p1 TRINITY_DN9631_c0_g1~~TRINITY_DN9631_c0_g1_i1.p1  ORF type:complete len:176 (-),score=68.00 TRINITY_DN9631_c0_g1_i1:157-651(-)
MPGKLPKVKPDDLVRKWKIVKGDKVQVIAGKCKGERGIVTKVIRDRNSCIVEGLNLVKKHQKGTEEAKGGIYTKEAPIHYSNMKLIDPKDGKPCRVKLGFDEVTGKKVRVSKRTSAVVLKPEHTKKTREVGPYDTPIDIAKKETFNPDNEEPFIREILKWQKYV